MNFLSWNYTIKMDTDLLKFRVLRKKLEREGNIFLKVASASMEPVLKVGQIIKVKKTQVEDLAKFDILVFWENNQLMCHFLWSVQKEINKDEFTLITKSIVHPRQIDIPLKQYLLLGKVDVTIPLYLKIRMWMKNL